METQNNDINGSGLFFFKTTLSEERQIEIYNWYLSLPENEKSFVEDLMREATDEANFFSQGD